MATSSAMQGLERAPSRFDLKRVASGLHSDLNGELYKHLGDEFLVKVADQLTSYVAGLNDMEEPVVNLVDAQQLAQEFEAAGVSLEFPDKQEPVGVEALLRAVSTALKYSVRTGHPLFFNQLYARSEPVSIAADWLTVAANTNVHTYEVAPVFTCVERATLKKLAVHVGGQYKDGEIDGLFVPGGSISNLYGLHLARNVTDPDFRKRGAVGGPHLVAFTSEEAHYSYLKSAFLTGLGTDNLITIGTDLYGAMDPALLEEAILKAKAEGKVPFFIGATAGTTVLGAFDPFDALADIAEHHGMWLHVDGCWGGALWLSKKHKYKLKGAERADSVAWNAHKMMGLPLQCSAFLTRHPGILKKTNGTSASYLFQPDKLNTELDLGDKTIQCGRRADAFKLWLAWKAFGDDGYEHRIQRIIDLADYFEEKVRSSGGKFVIAWPREHNPSVCFWYIPSLLRPFDPKTATKGQWEALAGVAPKLKGFMQRSGDAMIGFQSHGKLPNFFRIVFPNPHNITTGMVDDLLDRMDTYGDKLFGGLTIPEE